MSHVFISHSSADKEFVGKLANDLKQLGHIPWLDEWEIRVGQCIPSMIEEGLKKANYVVVVLTPEAVASGWVDREWKAKIFDEVEQRAIVILPVLLRTCEVPLLLKSRKYADVREGYAVALAQLALALTPTAIEQVLSPTSVPMPARDARGERLESLIQKVQRPNEPLAGCMSEALALARQFGDGELESFCRSELAGYDGPLDKRDPSFPRHRMIEAYASLTHRINPSFVGFGGSASAALSSIAKDPNFQRMSYFWGDAIAAVERQSTELQPKSSRSVMTWTVPVRAFGSELPGIPPEHPVSLYAHPGSAAQIIDASRAELTRRLLQLLPAAPGQAAPTD